MATSNIFVLCVDDDPEMLKLYERTVESMGLSVLCALDAKVGKELFHEHFASLALVISDYLMPGLNGMEFRRAILPKGASVPFLIVTGAITRDLALEAVDLKIEGFVDKPISSVELEGFIRKFTVERIQLIKENRILEQTFIEESKSILEELEPVILSLEGDRENPDVINQLYRYIHTIKGSSGILSEDTVTRYVHRLEDIISDVRSGQMVLSDAIYSLILKGFDRIGLLLAQVEAGAIRSINSDEIMRDFELGSKVPEAAKATPTKSEGQVRADGPKVAATKSEEKINVPLRLLDEMSIESGEITVIRNMVNKLVRSLERQYISNKEIQSLGELLEEMHKINSGIQHRIADLRKIPLSSVLRPIPRIVRDLSKELKKNVRFSVKGEGIRLDSVLASVCAKSIVHLVRNSLDHGIESPEKRAKNGKDECGLLEISCREQDEEIIVEVADDGGGIDHQVIGAKAVEKGLLSQSQVAAMSRTDILDIIFMPGFSTAKAVSDVSGRGVGMDMVRSSVGEVGGRVVMDSTPGKGTKFKLMLPVPKSVLIISSLLVEVNGRTYAIPEESIQKVLTVEAAVMEEWVLRLADSTVLKLGEHVLPLIQLNEVLDSESSLLNSSGESGAGRVSSFVILRTAGGLFACQVDRILDSEEIVVKSIPSCFNAHRAFSGATFLGDGNVGLILDVSFLERFAGTGTAHSLNKEFEDEISSDGEGPARKARQFVTFRMGKSGLFCVPIEQIYRLEEFEGGDIKISGQQEVLVYRNSLVPLFDLGELIQIPFEESRKAGRQDLNQKFSTLVTKLNDHFWALRIDEILDIVSCEEEIDVSIIDRPGVAGNLLIRDRTVTVLDFELMMAKEIAS